jgi:hypothetical protein
LYADSPGVGRGTGEVIYKCMERASRRRRRKCWVWLPGQDSNLQQLG